MSRQPVFTRAVSQSHDSVRRALGMQASLGMQAAFHFFVGSEPFGEVESGTFLG